VRKHANATRATVRFWRESDGWHIAVRDHGVGFDPTAVGADPAGRHVGITIMRERAESVGGRLEVHSQPVNGTEVRAWVPGRGQATPADDALLFRGLQLLRRLRSASGPPVWLC
jgi:signal transduction histidine kinase